MAPIHEHVVDRAIDAVIGEMTKNGLEKIGKLVFGHFARRHGELGMFNFPGAANVAIDWHIVRRIREDHLGDLPFQEAPIGFRFQRISA
jgi:hypothetical protein